MKTRILLTAALGLLASLPVPAEDKPFDFNRAKELHERSLRGETLTGDEQQYLAEARRRFQERTGMSAEQIDRLRALNDKRQRGETLTAEEQKLLDDARARIGQPQPPPVGDFDWDRAKALHERARRGETLSPEDQKFYDEAKRRVQAGQGPGSRGAPANDGFDWQRARSLFERKQRGESLSADEQKFLDDALRRRGGSEGRRPEGGGPPGPAISDPAVLRQLVPLPELQGEYKGQDGGLYGGGNNEPPQALQERAGQAIAKIRPLDAAGKPDAEGKIVLLSMGMSNTTQEFSRFVQKANADPRRSPRVVLVDGAQGGKDATAWAGTDDIPWTVAGERMKAAGVTPQQVQVIWMKQALIRPQMPFPAETDRLHDRLAEGLKLAKETYPNLRLVFLSSRTYGGYATTPLNPEPHAYESAFAVRRLILEQLPAEPREPVLLWGPYLWAAGNRPNRSDALTWQPGDVVADGTHPSPAGREKVADALLRFFTSNPWAHPWFVKKNADR